MNKTIDFVDFYQLFSAVIQHGNYSVNILYNYNVMRVVLCNIMFYIVGIGSILENVVVISILSTTFCSFGSRMSSRWSCVFILNLAFVDVVGVVPNFLMYYINIHSAYYGQEAGKYAIKFDGPLSTATKVLPFFNIWNSILATIFITLERYLHITRSFDYHTFVTTKTVVISILLTWLLPIATVALGWFIRSNEAIPSVNNGTYIFMGLVLLGVMLLLVFNTLYGRILFKYWKLKRRNSMRRKSCQPSRIRFRSNKSITDIKLDYPFCSNEAGCPTLTRFTRITTVQTIHTADGIPHIKYYHGSPT